MVKEGDCVAIFHSIHRVMNAEKILNTQQLDILLIPVPRQLSADCGMAIRFLHECYPQVQQALTEGALPAPEVWLMQAGKYHLLG
ncbi:MAG: DUF3343 domain-containing protein [Thermodesulfobacteriota bacterium]|nr:DUF3343 domain-containing protein [Thermodesulfobacteriota bacterium]